jgi:predicted HAD superfamily Cof-like phosphohydrolase
LSRVEEFHKAFDLPAPSGPSVPTYDQVALRMRLIIEEYDEVRAEANKLLRSLRRRDRLDDVIPILQSFVKEVCDLRYVSEGTLVALGREPEAYSEVHRSNMSKLGADGKPIRRDDGKVLKGPDYSPADPAVMFPPIIDQED